MTALDDDVAWLSQPHTLEELQQRYPAEWARARAQILTASADGVAGYRALIAAATTPVARPRDRSLTRRAEVEKVVQRLMVQRALQDWSDRAESGVDTGPIRFRRFDGTLLQHALFQHGLERKAVRMIPFQLAWRMSKQRDRLMPLVRERGIYCFYSRALLKQVVRIADGSPILEIAAGDGTLTRLLQEAGGTAHATDDYSWSRYIAYPAFVEHLDARAALLQHRPEVVVCSWPPAGNGFERHIFTTPSVRRYIAILSRDPSEAGNAAAYRGQTGFRCRTDPVLDRLVLPSDHNRVLVFSRNP